MNIESTHLHPLPSNMLQVARKPARFTCEQGPVCATSTPQDRSFHGPRGKSLIGYMNRHPCCSRDNKNDVTMFINFWDHYVKGTRNITNQEAALLIWKPINCESGKMLKSCNINNGVVVITMQVANCAELCVRSVWFLVWLSCHLLTKELCVDCRWPCCLEMGCYTVKDIVVMYIIQMEKIRLLVTTFYWRECPIFMRVSYVYSSQNPPLLLPGGGQTPKKIG